MRLLRPSPGEAADRQGILLLKCRYGIAKNVNTKPFEDEINELQTYLDVHYFNKINEETGEKYNQLFQQLKDVNNDLWRIEDEVRIQIRKPSLDRVRLVEIAIAVPTANDKRMALVQEINRLFNLDVKEKVYIADEILDRNIAS